MYWDVVEVKPEPDCCLFVQFKDGLAGRVKLRREELTGALAPLRGEQVFERGFIDHGADAACRFRDASLLNAHRLVGFPEADIAFLWVHLGRALCGQVPQVPLRITIQ